MFCFYCSKMTNLREIVRSYGLGWDCSFGCATVVRVRYPPSVVIVADTLTGILCR